MALSIMIAGLLAAVSGTTLAVAMGMDISLAFVAYGLFGIGGGMLACIGQTPELRNFFRHPASHNRTF